MLIDFVPFFKYNINAALEVIWVRLEPSEKNVIVKLQTPLIKNGDSVKYQ